jgi:hypothetical protein
VGCAEQVVRIEHCRLTARGSGDAYADCCVILRKLNAAKTSALIAVVVSGRKSKTFPMSSPNETANQNEPKSGRYGFSPAQSGPLQASAQTLFLPKDLYWVNVRSAKSGERDSNASSGGKHRRSQTQSENRQAVQTE